VRVSDFSRCALSSCVAAALLAGCGGSRPPIGAPPGAMPQSAALQSRGAQRDDRGSWMLPGAKGKDLAYVGVAGGAYVLSYPGGKLLGDIGGLSLAIRLCGDTEGNVYVVTGLSAPGTIYEYAHGGSQPIKTLSDPYGDPWDCAVDPTTGNLAVTNQLGPQEGHGNVVVYPNGTGAGQVYSDTNVISFLFCGYDNQGDLFVDATGTETPFLELPKGAAAFTAISLPKHLVQGTSVQWDGKYITVANFHGHEIYRVNVSGSTGTIVGITHLQGWTPHSGNVGSWIEGDVFLAPTSPKAYKLGLWSYPAGGKPTARWTVKGRSSLSSVFISRAKRP
jgi:hypothetical protein